MLLDFSFDVTHKLLLARYRFSEWLSAEVAFHRIFWSQRKLCLCYWMTMKWNENVSIVVA